MKQIKTAEEVLRGAMGDTRYRLNGVNANIELKEAMKAYAEQFINAAAEEICEYEMGKEYILKLKEHLK